MPKPTHPTEPCPPASVFDAEAIQAAYQALSADERQALDLLVNLLVDGCKARAPKYTRFDKTYALEVLLKVGLLLAHHNHHE